MTDLLDELAKLPTTENYSKKDRYHDFRRVFMTNDEGRKVLREILTWGGIFQPPALGNPIDPNRTHVLIGQRNIALQLMDVVYNEPKELPIKQITRSPLKRKR